MSIDDMLTIYNAWFEVYFAIRALMTSLYEPTFSSKEICQVFQSIMLRSILPLTVIFTCLSHIWQLGTVKIKTNNSHLFSKCLLTKYIAVKAFRACKHYINNLKKRDPSKTCRELKTRFDWTILLMKWATTWQNQQSDCAPSEDSDQPGHPPSLISLRCPHEENLGP